MLKDLIFIALSGFIVMGTLGVLSARRMGSAAFSLFAVLLGVAGLFALFEAHTAAMAQVVLYVGGVMVLVAFALFLYPEPLVPPRLIQFKQHLGKAIILLIISLILFYYLPWTNLNHWAKQQSLNSPGIKPSQDLASVGQNIVSQYPLEYELLGLLLLAGIVAVGWFIKSNSSTDHKNA